MTVNMKSALAGLALLLPVGMANATTTINLGAYNFSYDENFWGDSLLSQVGDVFTFSGLGYSASATGARRGWSHGNYYDYVDPAVSITAHSGYKISSIDTGVAGNLSSTASKPGSAGADVYSYVSWHNNDYNYLGDGAMSDNSSSQNGTSEAHKYDLNQQVKFADNTTTAIGYFSTRGSASATGKGSFASASHDQASFKVAVTPIPEPNSWAMMAGGFGLLGFMSYRRRKYF